MTVWEFLAVMSYTIAVFQLGYMFGRFKRKK